jgi:uncharacterized protein (TIGR03437 family)
MVTRIRSCDAHRASQTWKALQWFSFLSLIVPAAFSQALPQFDSDSVVNAASYADPISPGAIASIFGTNLASITAAAQGAPLPTELAGTSVTINGAKAPLFYVSPTQINLQVPWSTQIALFNYTAASVVVTTSMGRSTPVRVPVFQSGPSLFSLDGSGCGQAAALNISRDGSVSVNSPSNSAAPGDFISLYGTGIGVPNNPPANGDYSAGLVPLSSPPPGVVLGGKTLQAVQFAGLAPFLVGVYQINFQIPQGTPEGCAIPVSVAYGQFSMAGPTMSVSIHSGRGRCVDPSIQSFGRVTLMKTFMSGTAGTTADTLSASFPSGPGIMVPPPLPPSQPGSFTNNITPVTMSRSCPVNGNSLLFAGALSVQANSTGQTKVAPPIPNTGGVQYQQSLPNGFIAPGQYTVSASGPVQFQGTVTIPSPIQITTPLTPGTQVSVSNNFVINWTGGAPGELVRLRLVAKDGLFNSVDTAYVDAVAGSFTFSPVCMGNPPPMGSGRFCTFGVLMQPGSTGNVSVEVELLPSSEYANAMSAQGITQGVQISWMYRYVFSGMSFSQ